MLNRRQLLSTFAATSLPLPSLAQAEDDPPPDLGDGWPTARPTDANLDPDALAELADMIDTGTNFPNVHALLIADRERLVFEHYKSGEDWSFDENLGVVDHGPDVLHDIRSISKSVTSLLLGIALGDGFENALQTPIYSFFPDHHAPDEAKGAITLHHVLTMTAGLAWNEAIVPFDDRNDFFKLLDTDDPVGLVLGKDLRERPGTRWNYNSGLTNLVAALIEQITERPFLAYAQDVLFGPLDITQYDWVRPPAWGAESFPIASAGLRLTPRDLAKLGTLVAQNGAWQDRQIVSEPWIKASTTRHVQDTPWGPPGVLGYGYFWFRGKSLSGHQLIQASGWGDQRIFILPELRLSVSLLAGNYEDGGGKIGPRVLGRIIRARR